MPKTVVIRYAPRRAQYKPRRFRGRGKFTDFFKKAYGFLKKHKVISKGLKTVAPLLGPKYGALATGASGVASQLGLGRRRGMRASGLSLAGGRYRKRGGSLKLAGGAYGRRGA